MCVALTGEAMPRRLLGMQPAGWASPQLHPYAHEPAVEDPEHHAWTMLGPPAHGNIYSRLAAPRRFFSDSPEHAQEVCAEANLAHVALCTIRELPGICMLDTCSQRACCLLRDLCEMLIGLDLGLQFNVWRLTDAYACACRKR